MLYMTFKHDSKVAKTEKLVTSIKAYFDSVAKREWFDDDFVKEMILEIDQTECYAAYNMYSPFLGAMNFKQLSGGVKGLILLYKHNENKLFLKSSTFGDNCVSCLLKIAEQRDVYLCMTHILKLPKVFTAVCLDSGETISNYREYLDAWDDYSEAHKFFDKDGNELPNPFEEAMKLQ